MAKKGNNEGSIFKSPSGKWRAQVTVSGRRMGITTGSRAEAQAWVRKILDQVDHGLTYSEANRQLAGYLQDWIETKKKSLKPRTAYQYQDLIVKKIIPKIGHYKLKDISQKIINDFYDNLINEGFSTRNVRYTHSVLHAAFEHALMSGILVRNPTHNAILPRMHQTEMKILSEQQVSQFLVAASGSRYRMLYHLALSTGMRQAELFGLKWSDVDWINGFIKIQRQAQRVERQGIVFSEPKTRAGRRILKLGENILQELRKHHEHLNLERATAGDRWKDHDLLFPTSIGTPIGQSNLLKDYHRILRQSGLPHFRFHDLRHTAASLMINRGVPVIVVSKMLGHSQPSVTLNIYAHCMIDMQTQAADIMDEITMSIPIDLENRENIDFSKSGNENRLHAVALEIDPHTPN
jgi:integrase